MTLLVMMQRPTSPVSVTHSESFTLPSSKMFFCPVTLTFDLDILLLCIHAKVQDSSARTARQTVVSSCKPAVKTLIWVFNVWVNVNQLSV